MSDFANRFGPWALVTGASSGIGAEFAVQLAARKLNVVLVARRAERLQELAGKLEKEHGIVARSVPLDLSLADFYRQLEPALAGLEIGLLVNNAGFATSGSFLDNELEDELTMLHLNCRAPLILTHELGKRMAERGRGGIINVSSITAYSGVPAWSHYAATKAYELALSDGLAHELGGRGVAVLALCPGSTGTEFWQVTGGSAPIGTMSSASVVQAALRRLGRRSVVVPGLHNALSVLSTRLLPRAWNAWLWGRFVGSMLHK